MSGLDELGLVGLGLVPGGLRHPFGFGTEALLGADDYRDQVINVREDAGAQAMLTALGARADHSVDSERHLAAGKTLRGMEVSVQQIGAVVLPAVQSANVSLYEKFDVGVVLKEKWEGLSAAQREDLLDSFLDAAQAATETRVTEEEGQEAWCTTPYASSVLATDAELASLHTALDPITEQLSEDPDLARSLDRMRELGAGTVDPSPDGVRRGGAAQRLGGLLRDSSRRPDRPRRALAARGRRAGPPRRRASVPRTPTTTAECGSSASRTATPTESSPTAGRATASSRSTASRSASMWASAATRTAVA